MGYVATFIMLFKFVSLLACYVLIINPTLCLHNSKLKITVKLWKHVFNHSRFFGYAKSSTPLGWGFRKIVSKTIGVTNSKALYTKPVATTSLFLNPMIANVLLLLRKCL